MFAALTDALFPRHCLRCGREGSLWCRPCEETFVLEPPPASCPFCRRPGSSRTCEPCRPDVFLDGLDACGSYANPTVRAAITAWKYRGDPPAQELIARWLSLARVRETVEGEWMVASVPLHPHRARERGFDQSEVIARCLAERLSAPYRSLLARVRKTDPQAAQSHTRRQVGMLDDIFVRSGDEPASHVLLCDDVFTSGATMDAAARCLKESGAKTVWGFVVARG